MRRRQLGRRICAAGHLSHAIPHQLTSRFVRGMSAQEGLTYVLYSVEWGSEVQHHFPSATACSVCLRSRWCLLLARPQPFQLEMAQSVACEAQSSCQKTSRLPAAVVPCTQGSGNLSREAGVLVEEWATACHIGQDSQRRLEKEMSPSQLNGLSKAKHELDRTRSDRDAMRQPG